jgi:glycosyltransferase involved in cell wall biosynthesis
MRIELYGYYPAIGRTFKSGREAYEMDRPDVAQFVAERRRIQFDSIDTITYLLLESLRIHLPNAEVGMSELKLLIGNYGKAPYDPKAARDLAQTISFSHTADVSIIILCGEDRQSALSDFLDAGGDAAKTIAVVFADWIRVEADVNPDIIENLNRFAAVFVMSKILALLMGRLGLTNVQALNNYRIWDTGEPDWVQPRDALRSCVVFNGLGDPKGAEIAVRAIRLVNENLNPKVPLSLYSDLEEQNKHLDEYEVERKGDPTIRYMGDLSHIDPFTTLQQYDCLLFPTHQEDSMIDGIFVVALAAGLPIITTDWRYNSEVVIDGMNGYLVPVFNAEAIAKKVRCLIDHPDLVHLMSERNLELYRKVYSEEAATAPLIAELLKIAGN